MDTITAGTICIRLDAHHMTLLYQHAATTNTPIQVCAQELLTRLLEHHNPNNHNNNHTQHNINSETRRQAALLAQLEIN